VPAIGKTHLYLHSERSKRF